MFLVNDSHARRADQVRSWLARFPSVAVIVSAVYFEWTVSRALLALSRRPNRDVRKSLESVYGSKRCQQFWNRELGHLPSALPLERVVQNWDAVEQAFKSRNALVHGKERYTRNMARPVVDTLLGATTDVFRYAKKHGVDLNERLPIRKPSRPVVVPAGLSAHVQRQLQERGLEETSAVTAAEWLDAAGLLKDSPHRPGLPLRRILRADRTLVAGAEQRPAARHGRWFIRRAR